MHILAAQMNPTIGDLEGNRLKIERAFQYARAASADLLITPELALTGYPPEDLLLLPHMMRAVEQELQKLIQASQDLTAIVGLPRQNPHPLEKGLLNSAAVIQNGKLLGYYDKNLLPTYDVFDERRYFAPGAPPTLWDIAGHRVAITICEDVWQHTDLLRHSSYPSDPIRDLMSQKPDLLVNLSASPYNVGKKNSRFQVCQRTALALGCPIILCNQVGGNDSLIFDGYSLAVDASGHLIGEAAGFQEEFWIVDIFEKGDEKIPHHPDIEDLHAALVLGVRDYFGKLGLKKACIGLSGGIDSALVAVLAVEALGKDNVWGVSMPSRYSSTGSQEDAAILARNLGITLETIPIEKPFTAYLDLLNPHFEGMQGDTTEENLQARIRGMILMALSNKRNMIVLSTGNKSELAMGYSTLYGDLCGGLAVIGDLTKQQVYALSHHLNTLKPRIPQNTLEKPPSAELRPNQKDTDSLPDYAIVDKVLKAYIEDHRSPTQIAQAERLPLPLVQDLIHRIHLNEYKRRQAPPGLRISEKAFSVGRRFPIVQKWD